MYDVKCLPDARIADKKGISLSCGTDCALLPCRRGDRMKKPTGLWQTGMRALHLHFWRLLAVRKAFRHPSRSGTEVVLNLGPLTLRRLTGSRRA